MTTDLATWLLAQLDADERVAREAESTFGFYDGYMGGDEHIARHAPARVLAEVAAKRDILGRKWAAPGTLIGDDLIRLLAAPYAEIERLDAVQREENTR